MRFRLRSDLTYPVEATSDLTVPPPWSILATDPDAVGDSVTVTDPVTISPRRFLRLRVTNP